MSDLEAIIRDAIVNVAERSPGNRGPFVFDEVELQAAADKIRRAALPTAAATAVTVTDEMARQLIAAYRAELPGEGWPSLVFAKKLLEASLSPSPPV